MSKVWAWLKKNWKWLILPLWLASVILVWIFRGGDKPMFPVTGTTDKAADEALKAKDKAAAEFRARLDELAKKAEERLQNASEEQIKEYEELKDKPLDEVAKWIDSLS
jgi:flagellar biosynthesis/type III secretory pathway M-ring protein FliF/YscJ